MNRAFKGVWIPKEVWLSDSLTLQEKVFLVEIDSLDNEKGCFASNGHFAEFFGLSKNRCSEVIKSLEQKGMISARYVRGEDKKNIEKRILKVIDKANRGVRESEGGTRKVEEGYSEKCEGSNTSFSNTSISSSSDPFKFYQNNIGVLNPFLAENIQNWIEDTSDELVLEAIKITAKSGKNFVYAEGILKDWVKNNVRTVEDVIGKQVAFANKQKPNKKAVDWENI